MNGNSTHIEIGKVISFCGTMMFALVLKNNGDGQLHIYCHDQSDMRKKGVLLVLDESRYHALKTIMTKTDETIEKIKSSGQLKQMVL